MSKPSSATEVAIRVFISPALNSSSISICCFWVKPFLFPFFAWPTKALAEMSSLLFTLSIIVRIVSLNWQNTKTRESEFDWNWFCRRSINTAIFGWLMELATRVFTLFIIFCISRLPNNSWSDFPPWLFSTFLMFFSKYWCSDSRPCISNKSYIWDMRIALAIIFFKYKRVGKAWPPWALRISPSKTVPAANRSLRETVFTFALSRKPWVFNSW